MKLKIFFVSISLILSIEFVKLCFEYADAVRGYNAIGGEIFLVILPFAVVYSIFKIDKKIKNKIKRNEVK